MPHLRHGKAIQLEGILPKLVLGGKSKVGGCVQGCGQTARVPTGGGDKGMGGGQGEAFLWPYSGAIWSRRGGSPRCASAGVQLWRNRHD